MLNLWTLRVLENWFVQCFQLLKLADSEQEATSSITTTESNQGLLLKVTRRQENQKSEKGNQIIQLTAPAAGNILLIASNSLYNCSSFERIEQVVFPVNNVTLAEFFLPENLRYLSISSPVMILELAIWCGHWNCEIIFVQLSAALSITHRRCCKTPILGSGKTTSIILAEPSDKLPSGCQNTRFHLLSQVNSMPFRNHRCNCGEGPAYLQGICVINSLSSPVRLWQQCCSQMFCRWFLHLAFLNFSGTSGECPTQYQTVRQATWTVAHDSCGGFTFTTYPQKELWYVFGSVRKWLA